MVALESLSSTTFEPQLNRLLELYSVADPAQLSALLAVAEARVRDSSKSPPNATGGGASQKVLRITLGK